MSYTASQYDQTISSKSTIVPSDHSLEYQAGDTIRFSVPSFMGFIDARQSYLKMKIKVDAGVPVRFTDTIGCQSVINNLRIWDGTSTTQIENQQNYAERLKKEYKASTNGSIQRKRELIEGVEGKSTAYNFNESQLCDTYQPAGQTYNSAADPLSVPGQPLLCCKNEVDVCLPLSSGVLGGSKMFPSALTQGLKIEIDTNAAAKALELWDKDGLQNAALGVENIHHFGIQDRVGGDVIGTALTSVSLFAETAYGAAVIPGVESVAGLIPGQVSNVRNQLCGASNLIVGNQLVVKVASGAYVDVGAITGLSYVVGAASNVVITLDGTYNPAAAGDLVPILAHTGAVQPAGVDVGMCYVADTTATAYLNYRMNDIELVLKTAQPPKSYIDKLMKQTLSEEGAEIDIKTYETYRNNIQSAERTSQVNVPSFNERAISLFCLPMDLGTADSLFNDNFLTTIDTIENYQFFINGTGQPNRKVDLTPLSRADPQPSQLALWENEKALSSARVQVRDLKNPEKSFMISKAVARYGGVYDLKADGSFSLKQEYTNPSKNKLLLTYVCHLRRLRINNTGLVVEL
jgi:hypothetical protein